MKHRKTPTLSLCMIVKNEEEFLGQCLESVRDIVDEMIIVDTGSEDRTVEIAESYGAKVYHHKWQGSFSEARNYGLQFATGDWILQMDADEALEKDDIPVIKKAIQSDVYNTIFVALLSRTAEGWGKHYFQRIFRRGKAYYEGIVHNQLKYEGAVLHSEIRIYHWGYNLSKERMKEKYHRTEMLLKKQLEEDATNPFTYCNYLRILRAQQRYDDVIREGRKALEICRDRMSEAHRQMLMYDTALCVMLTDREDESERMCRNVLADHPDNLDVLFLLGTILLNKKKFNEAIDVFSKFLKVKEKEKAHPQANQLIVDSYSFEHKVMVNISTSYYELGEYEKAKIAAEKAVKMNPEELSHQVALARVYCKLGYVEETTAIFDNIISGNMADSDFFIRWAALCTEYPRVGDRLKIIELGIDRHPDSDELRNSLAYAIYSEDPAEAEKEWKTAIEMNPDHIGAHAGLARLYANEGRHQELKKQVKIIIKKVKRRDIFKKVGGYCLHAQLYAEAIDLFSQYLDANPHDGEVLSDVATCYAKLGQYEAALFGYREAINLGFKNAELIKNMNIVMKFLEKAPAV